MLEDVISKRIHIIEELLTEVTDKTTRKMLNETISELRDEQDDDYER